MTEKELPYTIIDNFLDPKDFQNIVDNCENNWDFPWFCQNNVTGREDDNDFYFTHTFFNKDAHSVTSHYFWFVKPLIAKLGALALVRIKANLYPRTDTLFHHLPHVDYPYNHKAAVFSINTCDGYTLLLDKYKIPSVANRVVLFDGSIVHSSTTCTDKKYRVNINFNYF